MNSEGGRGAAIDLRGVQRQFGEVLAVADLSLRVEPGEFLTLLGPSGCGKTTTLRMIGGFDYPTAGEICIDGIDVANLPPHKRPVNTVFQQYALFPHMSIGANVGYGLRMAGARGRELKDRVAAALEMVRLPDVAGRRPSELSGGQQQRVALARALVNRPRVLLLDEPLGALDLKLRKAMQLELKALNRDVGATFIYVTHDQEEALTMSDRIAVMNGGRILQLGTPADIYERPSTRFVADFIGQSNLIPATVREVVDGSVLAMLTTGEIVGATAAGETRDGDQIVISVRPEHIALTSADGEQTPGVRGRVRELVYVGTHVQCLVDIGQERDLVANVPVGAALAAGSEVVASFRATNARALADDRGA